MGEQRPFMTAKEAACYAVARVLDEQAMSLWHDSLERAVLGLPVSMSVDVGCGTGHFLGTISQVTGAAVLGIDASIAMLRQSAAVVQGRISLVCADGNRLPMRGGSVDLLFYSMVLHHLKGLSDTWKEARRCLRPGGLICIRTSTADRLEKFAYLRYFPSALLRDQVKMPSLEGIVSSLKAGGFDRIQREVIVQRAEPSVQDYVRMISMRSLSDLMSISDDEFDVGLASLKRDAARGVPISLDEPIDFVVARKCS